MKKNLVLIPFVIKFHCKPIIIIILCKFTIPELKRHCDNEKN